MITYQRLTISCKCPVDTDRLDEYEVELETGRIIPVEFVWATVADVTEEPAYQEEVTARLARALLCKVTTHGDHSGVEMTCVALP